MSAINLLEIQFSLLVFVSLSILIYLEWKRQTSAQAQIGRFLEKIVNFYWSEKSFILEVYKVSLGVFFKTSAEQKISEVANTTNETLKTAAQSGNDKADQFIAALEALAKVVTEATKKEEVIPFSEQVKDKSVFGKSEE